MFGQIFQVGDEYRSLTTPHEEDLAEIVASVKEAKRQANFVIFSSHSHEAGRTNNYPADFIVEVAHAVIDAGADIFLAHGPHVLRGIEIYKGKPIFYSLGDFLFQNETVPRQPADNYESYGLGPDAVAQDFFDARQRTGGFPIEAADMGELRSHGSVSGWGTVRGRTSPHHPGTRPGPPAERTPSSGDRGIGQEDHRRDSRILPAMGNRDRLHSVTRDQIREIAEIKMPNLNSNDIEGAMKVVEGTARSMGITVDG